MPFYASFNDVLSLCMIMVIIALLVGRSQSFASLHFVLSMSSTRASNSQKPSYSNLSTINSYQWYLQAIPSKFSCATFQKNLQNTSRFVTLFSAHGDVVVGFAIFHIVLFQKEKRVKKEKKKGTPPWYMNVGGHPMESVSHGL
jgi:hypothetical protein